MISLNRRIMRHLAEDAIADQNAARCENSVTLRAADVVLHWTQRPHPPVKPRSRSSTTEG